MDRVGGQRLAAGTNAERSVSWAGGLAGLAEGVFAIVGRVGRSGTPARQLQGYPPMEALDNSGESASFPGRRG